MKHLFCALVCLCLCACLTFPALAESPASATDARTTERFVSGDFEYELENGNAILTEYLGDKTTVMFPLTIDGYPITGISRFWANNGFRIMRVEAYRVTDSHPALSAKNGVLFDKSGFTLLSYPQALKQARYRVPDGVTSIAPNAFESAKFERVVLPESLRVIGDRAFAFTAMLTINLPDGLASLGDDVFDGAALTRLTIPKGVTHVGILASALDSISVARGNDSLEVVDGALINWREKTLVRYLPGNKAKTYAVPGGIAKIYDFAFYVDNALQKITLPDSVTEIGANAFYHCKALKEILLPATLISIGNAAFSDTYGIQYLEIPASVTAMDDSALYGTATATLLVYQGSYAEEFVRTHAEAQGLRYAVLPRP